MLRAIKPTSDCVLWVGGKYRSCGSVVGSCGHAVACAVPPPCRSGGSRKHADRAGRLSSPPASPIPCHTHGPPLHLPGLYLAEIAPVMNRPAPKKVNEAAGCQLTSLIWEGHSPSSRWDLPLSQRSNTTLLMQTSPSGHLHGGACHSLPQLTSAGGAAATLLVGTPAGRPLERGALKRFAE
jgi:hypothetical protein